MNWRFVAVIALLATAIATTWLLFRQPSDRSVGDSAADLPAGYYLLDATITGTNEAGREAYTVRARQIDHDPADDSVSLHAVEMTYADDDDGWRLGAERGQMPASGDSIDLDGNVRISEQAADANGSVITTAQLTIDIPARTAATDAQVRVDFDSGFLTADGLDADLENKRLSLRSNVHGEFNAASDASD